MAVSDVDISGGIIRNFVWIIQDNAGGWRSGDQSFNCWRVIARYHIDVATNVEAFDDVVAVVGNGDCARTRACHAHWIVEFGAGRWAARSARARTSGSITRHGVDVPP